MRGTWKFSSFGIARKTLNTNIARIFPVVVHAGNSYRSAVLCFVSYLEPGFSLTIISGCYSVEVAAILKTAR
jgi:hypothetical protein